MLQLVYMCIFNVVNLICISKSNTARFGLCCFLCGVWDVEWCRCLGDGEWTQVEAEVAEITEEGAISVSVFADEKVAFYKFVVSNK